MREVTEYEYDADGKLAKNITYNVAGEVTDIYEYSYEGMHVFYSPNK